MDFLNYLLVSIAAFSGLWAGALLAFIAPEEMKAGKKYFNAMIKIVFILIPIVIALFLGKEKLLFSVIFVLLSAMFMIYAPKGYIYPLLGVFFYIAGRDDNLFPIIATTIFILGMPKGSIFAYEHHGMKKARILRKIMIMHSLFFVIALPLFFSDL